MKSVTSFKEDGGQTSVYEGDPYSGESVVESKTVASWPWGKVIVYGIGTLILWRMMK